jgi:hypothetical protein
MVGDAFNSPKMIRANDAAFGGICENFVDSLTYALRNLNKISFYIVCSFMPSEGHQALQAYNKI